MNKIRKLIPDPSVVLLAGPRRVGKTVLLRQTVREYLHFLEEAFILQRVAKFSPSVNERIYAEAKYYPGTGTLLKLPRNRDDLAYSRGTGIYLPGRNRRWFLLAKVIT